MKKQTNPNMIPLRFERGRNLEPECAVVTMAATFGKSLRPRHLSARAFFDDMAEAHAWQRQQRIPTWVRCSCVAYTFLNGWQDKAGRTAAMLRLEIDLVGRHGEPVSSIGRDRALRFLAGVRASSHAVEWQAPAGVPRCYQSLDAFAMSLEITAPLAAPVRQYRD